MRSARERYRDRPYVGLGGTGGLIRVVSTPEATTCRQSAASNLHLAVGLALFGPYVGWVLYQQIRELSSGWPLLAALAVFCGAGCLLMARHLLLQRRVELRHADGRIELYPSAWARQPELAIEREEIEGFRLSRGRHEDAEENSVPNYFLAALLRSGEPVTLCVSGERGRVEQLLEKLQEATGCTHVEKVEVPDEEERLKERVEEKLRARRAASPTPGGAGR